MKKSPLGVKKTPLGVKRSPLGAKKLAARVGKGPALIDARQKIIQKKRVQILDAREIIAVRRKPIRDARELLSTKKPAAQRTAKRPAVPRARPNRKQDLVDDDDDEMDYISELSVLDLSPIGSLKRTVQNDMFRSPAPPITMPKLPKFSIAHEASRISPDPFDCYNVPTRRIIPAPPVRPERIERYQPNSVMSAHMDKYEPRKSILRSAQADDHDDRFDNDRYFASSTDNVRSRLYNDSRDRYESAGIFAKLPVRGASPPFTEVGHRIVVSNLHTTVTESDVRELFEDIGALVFVKLSRPGVAEVVFKKQPDAEEAVETYHNRQLDGQPMKCMLVRASGKSASYKRI